MTITSVFVFYIQIRLSLIIVNNSAAQLLIIPIRVHEFQRRCHQHTT